MKNTAAKKNGRPPIMNPELMAEICARVAAGSNLRRISMEPGMPALSTVFDWFSRDQTFSENYARARMSRADARADQIDEIADGVLKGKIGANEARVVIDALKWQAGKEQPKRYGDRIDVEHAGKVDVEVTIGGDERNEG